MPAPRKTESTSQSDPAAPGPGVTWDDSEMRTSYANVVNVTSTREDVSTFFGINETWKAQPGDDLLVKLDSRIIMSPHAAKRLHILLTGVLREYEKRFGPLGPQVR